MPLDILQAVEMIERLPSHGGYKHVRRTEWAVFILYFIVHVRSVRVRHHDGDACV